MDQLQHFLDVAYDVRWVIVAIVLVTLGLLYADALGTLGRAVQANRDLAAENAALRRRLFLKAVADPEPRRVVR